MLKELLIPKAPICSLYPRFQEFQSCVSSSWRSGLKEIKTHKNISKNIRIILQISAPLENSRCCYIISINSKLKTPKTQRFSSCLFKRWVQKFLLFSRSPMFFGIIFVWPKNLGAPNPPTFQVELLCGTRGVATSKTKAMEGPGCRL